ncbi:VWA domain-containing protein [Halovulum sp. GXIMD14794]
MKVPGCFGGKLTAVMGALAVLAAIWAAHVPVARAQTKAQLQAMEEQAGILDAAPVLQIGKNNFSEVDLAEGLLAWIEAPEDGIYSLALDAPGALFLSSFPTPDGRYDGRTAPRRHVAAGSLTAPPRIGPMLLAAGQPYLVSLSASTGATATLTQDRALGPLDALPERDAPLETGELLLRPDEDLRLSLPAPDAPLKVEVMAEARADWQADLGGTSFGSAGLYPWAAEDDARFTLRARVTGDGSPPLVLVRVTPDDSGLDEAEPNRTEPNPITPGTEFTGALIHENDYDLLGFTLDAPRVLELAVASDSDVASYTATLMREETSGTATLWSRTATLGQVVDSPLALSAGSYRLELHRQMGDRDAVRYSVILSDSAPAATGHEIEPNDTSDAAMALPESLRVRGALTPDDTDMFGFTVPHGVSDNLWRLMTAGAERLILHGRDGVVADVRAKGGRAVADALALVPGDYRVELRGDGDYSLRVMDLGTRPGDYEGEPNDAAKDGQRLEFGRQVRGAFHSVEDTDSYLFRLDAESPVEITVTPPGDGELDARLMLEGTQHGGKRLFRPGEGAYSYRATLPAGDWEVRVRSTQKRPQGTYSVRVERLAAIVSQEPDDRPVDAVKLPRDGDISAEIGAFDGIDHVFLPLPEGSGTAAVICDGGPALRSWALWNWSTGKKILNPTRGMTVQQYDPDLGGAVRLQIDGGEETGSYDCRMRFAPEAWPDPGAPITAFEQPLTLAPGESVAVTWVAGAPRPGFTLDLPEGAVGAFGCRGPGGPLAFDTGLMASNLDLVRDAALEGLYVLRARDKPLMRLRDPALEDMPFSATCTLLGPDDLARPSDMGPPAEFRLIPPEDAPAEADDAPVPPPPGMAELMARKVPEQQPTGDLPVAISFQPAPTLAAYDNNGQHFPMTATLRNSGDIALELDLSARVDADGWRLALEHQTLALAPGAEAKVKASLTAPPWLSPVIAPGLVLRADSDDDFAAGMTTLPAAPGAIPVNPASYWLAPEALRGGLNVLHHGLGARLVRADGIAADENEQTGRAYLHDGFVPHTSTRPTAPDLEFSLAAPATLVGGMVQLRSTAPPKDWPSSVEIYTSATGEDWKLAAARQLASSHAPQYLVFDTPTPASHVRVRFPECRGGCARPTVQEIQMIAVPGTHPEGLPPINAGDPALGGHVVHTAPNLGGDWNSTLLVAEPDRTNRPWSVKTGKVEQVVAFHQNRAALLSGVAWVGDPDEEGRLPEAEVSVSTDGPSGPWQPVGALPSPGAGELRTDLRFEAPVWARYLRLTYRIPEGEKLAGPDAIEALEVPGTSVLGLWEDESPRAAYEAREAHSALAAVDPAGGPEREAAVALLTGTPVASSVLIERNEDWWRIDVPDGPAQELVLDFGTAAPDVAAELEDGGGTPLPLTRKEDGRLSAVLRPGPHYLRIHEPPRSVMISWDTSGSVAAYLPRTLAAVRTWARSLKPGRDALNLLPFGVDAPLLAQWAESPDVLEPVLADLPQQGSSDAEGAMRIASEALMGREGARGIVIITDAETGMDPELWSPLLRAAPRVVALSVDSSERQNAAILMDWAAVNGGRFQRVIGPLGLADGMDMAAALFRSPKAYRLTASLEEIVEPEGEITLTISAAPEPEAVREGAIEVILDASGSMLQRLDGRRRIEVAHEALSSLVRETLPEGTPFAFRAFGLEEDACRTELRLPLAPLDRARAEAEITGVPAINLAKTAIADSLRAAGSDLAGASAPRVIVLVTDGEETCDGDPAAAIEELRAQGLDVRVNIVGFAIDDADLVQTFSAWAEAGGGTYFDAGSAEALNDAVAQALIPRFEVVRTYLDGRVETVGRVALGETVVLPAGRLTIRPASAATGEPLELQVLPEEVVGVTYGAGRGMVRAEE